MEMAGNQGWVTDSPASELEELSKESNSLIKGFCCRMESRERNDSRDLNYDASRLRIYIYDNY